MNDQPAQSMDRSSVRRLYFVLVAGLVTIMGVFSILFVLGTAPLLRGPDNPRPIAAAMTAATVASLMFGWLWARPQVAVRQRAMSVDDYWRDPVNGGRALLLWVVWEGGTIISTVATLLTGSAIPASGALLGLALLLTNGPGYLEGR